MQFAKDSFYMALRSRLAELNPQRAVVIDGVSQAAILVGENEPVTSAERLNDCFYVSFGAAKVLSLCESAPPLMSVAVTLSYRTRGTVDGSADRGRSLGKLDSELIDMCSIRSAPKCDYSKDPVTDLGTKVFWSAPHIGDVEPNGAELSREVQVTLYFYPEINAA